MTKHTIIYGTSNKLEGQCLYLAEVVLVNVKRLNPQKKTQSLAYMYKRS